jgi:hypothetical protein
LTPGDTSVYQIGIFKIVLVLKEGFPQETNSPADSRATALSKPLLDTGKPGWENPSKVGL